MKTLTLPSCPGPSSAPRGRRRANNCSNRADLEDRKANWSLPAGPTMRTAASHRRLPTLRFPSASGDDASAASQFSDATCACSLHSSATTFVFIYLRLQSDCIAYSTYKYQPNGERAKKNAAVNFSSDLIHALQLFLCAAAALLPTILLAPHRTSKKANNLLFLHVVSQLSF